MKNTIQFITAVLLLSFGNLAAQNYSPVDEIVVQPELRQFFSPSSSQWDIGDWDGIPLPVTLSSFTALCVGGEVKLDWGTASEINNYGFEILRTDTTEDWQIIGFVPGHGTSYSPKTYSFIDADTLCGDIRYRLKQIDNSGIYEYSSICEVFVPAITELEFELSSFTASCFEGNVRLDWETATETNIYGYDILRTDTTDEWQTIGFVSGHGTSDSGAIYSFIDTNTLCGNIKYCLKLSNQDGQFEYSSVVEVFVETATGLDELTENLQYVLNQNYPNPFNPSTIISFTLPEASHTKLTIYNAIGQEVVEVINKQMEAGNHNVNFEGSNLASGFYIYRLDTANYSKTMKMMLLR